MLFPIQMALFPVMATEGNAFTVTVGVTLVVQPVVSVTVTVTVYIPLVTKVLVADEGLIPPDQS